MDKNLLKGLLGQSRELTIQGIKLLMARTSGYYIRNASAVSHPAVSPQEIAEWVFSQADWIYTAREPAAIKRLFIRERRALALNWLSLIRHRAALIVFSYSIYLPNLRPSDRLKLKGNYALFLSIWAALFFLVRCSNPIHFSKLAALALSQMERLSHPLPSLKCTDIYPMGENGKFLMGPQNS